MKIEKESNFVDIEYLAATTKGGADDKFVIITDSNHIFVY